MTPDTRQLMALADEATELLKALSHPARLIICCHLRDTEMAVGDIEATLDIRQPRLSRELAKLRDEGLVETRREAKQIYYTLSKKTRIRNMVDAICAVMLGSQCQKTTSTTPTSTKQRNYGGYGVFAQTEDQK